MEQAKVLEHPSDLLVVETPKPDSSERQELPLDLNQSSKQPKEQLQGSIKEVEQPERQSFSPKFVEVSATTKLIGEGSHNVVPSSETPIISTKGLEEIPSAALEGSLAGGPTKPSSSRGKSVVQAEVSDDSYDPSPNPETRPYILERAFRSFMDNFPGSSFGPQMESLIVWSCDDFRDVEIKDMADIAVNLSPLEHLDFARTKAIDLNQKLRKSLITSKEAHQSSRDARALSRKVDFLMK